VRSLFLVAVSAGCSLLFDPAGIVPGRNDLALEDLNVSTEVDDLAVPADLSVPDDLSMPDLLLPDLKPLLDLFSGDLLPCVPGNFLGFYDGGSSDPFDCTSCGCSLDPLTTPSATANRFTHQIVGLAETVDVNGISITSATAANSDYDLYQSQNKFYLDGDFEILLDYQYPGSTDGASLFLFLLGPVADGGTPYAPWAYTQLYSSSGMHVRLFTEDRYLDVAENLASGTLRVRRNGAQLCAGIVGHEEVCHANTFQENRVWVQIFAQLGNGNCASVCGTVNACCSYSARISNLRLKKGVVRQTP
jgi:hypothetical protein